MRRCQQFRRCFACSLQPCQKAVGMDGRNLARSLRRRAVFLDAETGRTVGVVRRWPARGFPANRGRPARAVPRRTCGKRIPSRSWAPCLPCGISPARRCSCRRPCVRCVAATSCPIELACQANAGQEQNLPVGIAVVLVEVLLATSRTGVIGPWGCFSLRTATQLEPPTLSATGCVSSPACSPTANASATIPSPMYSPAWLTSVPSSFRMSAECRS